MARKIARILIHGRVQGVGFRAWVFDTATSLGLDGWVRNRRNGSVEALFEGPPDAVADMLAQCSVGPRPAMVSHVEHLPPGSGMAPTGFEIRATL